MRSRNLTQLERLLEEARVALQRQDRSAVIERLDQALQHAASESNQPSRGNTQALLGALHQIAQGYAQVGESGRAADVLARLAAQFPQDAPLHFNLGQMLRQADRYADAATAFARVVALNPEDDEARLLLAIESARAGALAEAIVALKDLAHRRPDDLHVRYLLSAYLELDNRLDEAREVCDALLSEAPNHTGANLVRAKLERRAGDTDLAIKRLNSLLPLDPQDPLAAGAEYELVRLYDSDNQPGEAMAACARAAAATLLQVPDAGQRAMGYRRQLQYLLSKCNAQWVASWTDLPADSRNPGESEDPVFIVGFPRSGTTLLDQVLDAHPDFQVMEERNALHTCLAQVDSLPGGYPASLAQLDHGQRAALRAGYWQFVEKEIQRDPQQRLVDKLPLSAVNLGLIQRLFPKASIILALRHPVDAVLSCYMQSFGINDAMANFLDSEDALATYDLVMQLVQRYRELLPLNLLEVRYEDLVSDLEAQSRRLLQFLDVPFDPRVLKFYQHSQARGQINTPSYHQVSRPIYTQARYRWRRYRQQVQAWHAALDHWISRFGYDKEI